MVAFELLLDHVQHRGLALPPGSHQRSDQAVIGSLTEQGSRELISERGTAEAIRISGLDRVVAAHRSQPSPLPWAFVNWRTVASTRQRDRVAWARARGEAARRSHQRTVPLTA